MKKIICQNEKETERLAFDLAKKMKGGEIIALEGDLGAGKTTFVKAMGKALGIKQHITSPTFVLMKIYEIRNKKYGIRNLVHVDCYRLDEPQELFYLGLEEYLNKKNAIVIIEWADKIKNFLKKFKHIIWLKFKTNNSGRRIIIIK